MTQSEIDFFYQEKNNSYYLRLTHKFTGIIVEGKTTVDRKNELKAILNNRLVFKVRKNDYSEQPEKRRK